MNAKIKLFYKSTPVEGNALEQLQGTAQLPGVLQAVGMPDLHVGKGHPIGAAFLTEKIIYPYLVGNDIGCGMSLSKLDIPAHKLKRDKLVKKLGTLELGYQGDLSFLEKKLNISLNQFTSSLGTVGGGNHFVELQVIEQIFNEELFKNYNLDKKVLYVMTHSGSRGLGESILRDHIDNFKSQGLIEGTPEFKEYLSKHDYAVTWAKANRELLLKKVCENLNAESTIILDIVHNWIKPYGTGFLHRKGTAPSDEGIIVIPGSRGDLSYIVKPLAGDNLYSLAHGAGRKWKRSESKDRLSERYRVDDLLITDLKSQVICEDKDLLYEEAPENYKKISRVIQDLVDFQLIEVIATLKPVVTYKKKQLDYDDHE